MLNYSQTEEAGRVTEEAKERATTTQQRAQVYSRIIKAMSHPFRAWALTELNERIASPKELATEYGEEKARANYHMRKLDELGCIELVQAVARRGAVEHFYRAIERSLLWGEHWAAVPLPVREGAAASILSKSYTDATKSFDAGKFEGRADRHLSRTPLFVDEEAWKAISKLHDETLDATLKIQAEAYVRIRDGAPGFHAEAVQMTFETAEAPDPSLG